VFAAPPLQREDSNSDRTPAQAYDDRPARARGSYTGNDDDPPTLPDPVAAPRARPDQPPAPPKGTFCPWPACLPVSWGNAACMLTSIPVYKPTCSCKMACGQTLHLCLLVCPRQAFSPCPLHIGETHRICLLDLVMYFSWHVYAVMVDSRCLTNRVTRHRINSSIATILECL